MAGAAPTPTPENPANGWGGLFPGSPVIPHGPWSVREGAILFMGMALGRGDELMGALGQILALAPFRHMETPGGRRMSVAMSNCGTTGWISDRRGYRYTDRDPMTGHPWPPLPAIFRELAEAAADQAGFPGFHPDVCLVNGYRPGSGLSLHQDRDERDGSAPIVSVSLGLPATFLFGGIKRRDPVEHFRLHHGDVFVWGGASRYVFHGIARLAPGHHPVTGAQRINLTFRQAL